VRAFKTRMIGFKRDLIPSLSYRTILLLLRLIQDAYRNIKLS